MTRGIRALVCALAVVAAGCTSTAERSDDAADRARAQVDDVVDQVIEAWVSLDEVALAELLDNAVQAQRIVRVAKRAMESAQIEELDIEPEEPVLLEAEPVNEDVLVGFDVPYEIFWRSEVVPEVSALEGVIDLEYSDENETWRVSLGPSDLWPGVTGARGLIIELDRLKRGSIKDRRGKIIATGRAEARRYPFGITAGTTVGHIGRLTKKEAKETGGLEGDLIGASGLEEAFDEVLAGEPNASLHVVGRRDRVLETLGEADGERGRNVKVTLDMKIQQAAEQAFGGTVGGAVIVQPRSGDLLAIVDSSTFGPGNYVGAEGVHPFNRALEGGYPPGSSMKVVTAAAALDSGTVKPDTTVTGPAEYQGVRNFESGEFGSIPFSTAVKFSVNTAFAQVAQDLGAKKLTRYADAFGFNTELEMPLDTRVSSFPEPADLGDLMWSSVGQAQVLATPLQMASVVATIANGGKRMEPRIDMDTPKSGDRVVGRKAARQLTTMMESAVQGGTGVNAQIPGVSIAGKTGTAEVDVAGERKNHAWFVCFAPSGAPRLAVAVVSEYGGVGGQVAAPLARAILQRVLPLAP